MGRIWKRAFFVRHWLIGGFVDFVYKLDNLGVTWSWGKRRGRELKKRCKNFVHTKPLVKSLGKVFPRTCVFIGMKSRRKAISLTIYYLWKKGTHFYNGLAYSLSRKEDKDESQWKRNVKQLKCDLLWFMRHKTGFTSFLCESGGALASVIVHFA